MIEINAEVIDTDYDSLVQTSLPLLKQNPDALGTNRFVKTIVQKVVENSSRVSTLAEKIPNTFKDDVFVFVVSYYAMRIKDKLQEFVNQKGWGISIQDIAVEKHSAQRIMLKISVREIDYTKMIPMVLPLLHFDEEKSETARFGNEVIRVLKEVPKAASIIVAHISPEIKDELTILLITRYESAILVTLQHTVELYGIKTTVQKLTIRKI